MSKETFPQTDITDEESDLIHLIWGQPVPDPLLVGVFLDTGGRSLIDHELSLSWYLLAAKRCVSENLGVSRQESDPAFTHGALLYASVLTYVAPELQPRVTESALGRLGAMETVDFIFDSRDRLRDEDPRFCRLIDRMMPAVGLMPDMKEIVEIGAGAVHLAMHEAGNETAILEEYSGDPALQDLRDLFKDFEE